MKKSTRSFAFAAVALAALLSGGCATVQFTPGAATAYVKGVDRLAAALTFHEERAVVARIDGTDTDHEFLGFNLGNYVAAGSHDLLVNWSYHGVMGSTPVPVNLEANHVYGFNISEGPTLTLDDETVGYGISYAVVGNWALSAGALVADADIGDRGAADVELDFGVEVGGDGSGRGRPPGHSGDQGGGDHHAPPSDGDRHGPPPSHPSGGNPPPSHSGGSGGPVTGPHNPGPSSGGGANHGGGGNPGAASGHMGGGGSPAAGSGHAGGGGSNSGGSGGHSGGGSSSASTHSSGDSGHSGSDSGKKR